MTSRPPPPQHVEHPAVIESFRTLLSTLNTKEIAHALPKQASPWDGLPPKTVSSPS